MGFGLPQVLVELEILKPQPKRKALAEIPSRAFLLAYKDSNLDRQNQNLMCYRYTIGQTSNCFFQKRGKGITISQL